MESIEHLFDRYLNINTSKDGSDKVPERMIYAFYQPTNYHFLERLFTKYPFKDDDYLVDFGCGKGRVMIMASHYNCRLIEGYEIDEDIYNKLIDNIACYQSKFKSKTIFKAYNIGAGKVEIDDKMNKFFFFEPFHLKIFIKVIKKIISSVEKNNRDITIFLHEPTDHMLEFLDEISVLSRIETNYEYHEEKKESYNICTHAVYTTTYYP